jgi:hypothetical protein
VLAAGDGALGFWGALREVFPETHEQRSWFHAISNVLAALPKSAYTGAEGALADLERRGQTPPLRRGDRVPGHLRGEVREGERQDYRRRRATFATVRNRSKTTKGPGSRAAGIAMAYKLIEARRLALVASA